jgi:hypothetical protein
VTATRQLPARRIRPGRIAYLLVAVLLGAAVWFLLRRGNYVANEIAWVCDHNSCGTNDARAVLPVAGIVLDVLLGIMLLPVLRLLGAGIALGLGPLAAVTGWHAAAAEGRVPIELVSADIAFWRAVAIVGAVLAVLGLLLELLRPGPSWLLLRGWDRVPARLHSYTGPADGSGTAVLAFTDSDGRPHQVMVRARPSWERQPVQAIYPVRDPSRARVAPSWRRRESEVESGPAPASSLAGELERLANLHREGQLTDAEYEVAKRRVLGG